MAGVVRAQKGFLEVAMWPGVSKTRLLEGLP